MSVSLSEQLILGILAEQPRHGYDIEKLIVERGMRQWTDIGFSSIYYVLDRLEAKGLAASSESQGKDKKQYAITEQGFAVLYDEAKKLVAQRKPANTHFMTGLATSGFVEAAEIAQSLRQRQTQLSSDLEALLLKQSVSKNIPQSAQRLFSLSEVLLRAELDWTTKELERTKK